MNILTDPEHLKNLMRGLKFKPNEVLGQNFLVDENALSEIISVAQIKPTETVVEIGPGLGVLTGELVKSAARVIAIEKDKRFIDVLKSSFRQDQNLEIIDGDALQFNFEQIKGDYKIVANIPYYLTSHLLQNLLALKHKPALIVLMMQKEVGERIVAEAGELSILGISVQVFADAAIEVSVPKTSFWPRPKVDSVIISIRPSAKFPEIADQKSFFRILKIAFAGKRKQIHNALANGLKISKEDLDALLEKSGVPRTARPQDLTIKQWISLYKNLKT